MTAAKAKATSKALKTAEKNAAAKGITRPRHAVLTSSKPVLMNTADFLEATGKAGDDKFQGFKPAFPNTEIDKPVSSVVQSDYGVDDGTATATTNGESTMTNESAPASGATEAQAKREAEAKAKIEAKAAKKAEAEAKKAAAQAEKEAKAAARAAETAEKKVQREAAAAARKAELEANGTKRTYFGPMLNLADKVKAGVYVKGVNGQLRSSDPVALALESCSAANVVKLLVEFLVGAKVIEGNKYAALNIGQQSMNLRNVLRGAIKAGKVKIEDLIAARDAGDYADAEKAIAAKAEAKAKRDAEKAAAAEAKAKADAEKKRDAEPPNQESATA